jgi:hypothetical protein
MRGRPGVSPPAANCSTALRAASKPPKEGYRIVWDDEVKGFGIRITANGAKAFVFNYRTSTGHQG